MQVEYRLYLEDHDAFQRNQSGKGRQWVVSLVLWILCAIVTTALAVTDKSTRTWAIGGFVAVTAGYVWRWYAQWTQRRRVARDLEQRFEKGNAKLSLAPDGVYVVDPNSQSFTVWSGILRIVETPTHAFFYVQLNQAIILPARAFASAVEFRTFVGLARKYKDSPPAAPDRPTGPPDAITRTTDFTH
jgi:hypothetical protein